MDVMVDRLNGIMAQVLHKALTEDRLNGIMVPVPLKELMADLQPGVKAQDLLPMHEVAQHPGVGKRSHGFLSMFGFGIIYGTKNDQRNIVQVERYQIDHLL